MAECPNCTTAPCALHGGPVANQTPPTLRAAIEAIVHRCRNVHFGFQTGRYVGFCPDCGTDVDDLFNRREGKNEAEPAALAQPDAGEDKALPAVPDDADVRVVLRYLRLCASSWAPGTRPIGNLRACDIVRMADAYLEATPADTPPVLAREEAESCIERAKRRAGVGDEAFVATGYAFYECLVDEIVAAKCRAHAEPETGR